ncbi:hypothetical protein GCM10010252_43710 [Streptomyces aureoverticillatus]|nr:hypothetical protein GCM10010252_43710 [Streptomyces aureoverticillatus]
MPSGHVKASDLQVMDVVGDSDMDIQASRLLGGARVRGNACGTPRGSCAPGRSDARDRGPGAGKWRKALRRNGRLLCRGRTRRAQPGSSRTREFMNGEEFARVAKSSRKL